MKSAPNKNDFQNKNMDLNIQNLPNYQPFEIDYSFLKRHKLVNIQGIDIHFPYEIYDNQIKYMEKIIELLNTRINSNQKNIAALESPTGTGKTLCLLCSTLAWVNEMRRQKKYGGKIIYTSRTHSQISQVIHELRKTCYRPRTAVLASRDHGCVNSKIKTENVSGNILNIKCRKFCVKCEYYNGVLSDKRERNNMLDIEELYKNGKSQTFCPFYQQIEIAKSYSDIVFMPYNYIFDEDINKIMEFDIKNDILIIDEAHNIRKVCEDSKSIEIKSNDFDDIITDLNSLLTLDEDGELIMNSLNQKKTKLNKSKKSLLDEISKDDIASEKTAIEKIQKQFNDYNIKSNKKGEKIKFEDLFNIFILNENSSNKKRKKKKKIKYNKDDELSCDSNVLNISEDITGENLFQHIEFLEKLNKNFQDIFEKGTKITILLKIFNIINQIMENIILKQNFVFYMEETQTEKIDKETEEPLIDFIKKFNIFCFSPQLGFSDILKSEPFSIIFTSGTLSPFKLYENELKIKFDITLENNHIVPNDQINFNILSEYENGVFKFDYKNRKNINMIKDLGNKILNYCSEVRNGGILVFFPSFYFLNLCKSIWNENGINKKIEVHKKIFIDSSQDKKLISQLKEQRNKNYIFFSVYRGVASEGLDFSDDSARAVICIGIPFADYSDLRVKLKIEYLNNIHKDNNDSISGNEWYLADAMTAVNQSLGRVIRHKNDYGSLLCIDERFNFYIKYFSYWIRDYYEKNKDNHYINNVNDFLMEQREKFKDIMPNNIPIYLKKEVGQSGFSNVIKLEDSPFFKNIIKDNNKISEDDDENDNSGDNKMEIDIEEDEDNSKNNKNNNNNDEDDEKLIQNNIFNYPKIKEENVNTITIIENKNIKTNYFEILNSILPEKSKKKNCIEIWKVKKEDESDKIFEAEEKKAKELLESLKLFAKNNIIEFNNILNKYK